MLDENLDKVKFSTEFYHHSDGTAIQKPWSHIPTPKEELTNYLQVSPGGTA